MSYYKSNDFIQRCNQTNKITTSGSIAKNIVSEENFQTLQIRELPRFIENKTPKPVHSKLNIKWDSVNYMNPKDPEVWGPSFWFTLHNGSINYPLVANDLCKQRMKQFIIGMEVMIPCEKCSDHATSYIEKNWNHLDEIVSTRDNLFKFFVDFHNEVNKRYNKPLMSYDEAYKLYSCNVSIKKMSYN
jgi:hypothetical protein